MNDFKQKSSIFNTFTFYKPYHYKILKNLSIKTVNEQANQ